MLHTRLYMTKSSSKKPPASDADRSPATQLCTTPPPTTIPPKAFQLPVSRINLRPYRTSTYTNLGLMQLPTGSSGRGQSLSTASRRMEPSKSPPKSSDKPEAGTNLSEPMDPTALNLAASHDREETELENFDIRPMLDNEEKPRSHTSSAKPINVERRQLQMTSTLKNKRVLVQFHKK